METIDEEVLAVTQDFLARAKNSGKPFFCWFNTTRMHNFTHVKEANLGKTGLGFYADGMVEHDALVGKLLKTVDELGLTPNTIVVYTTDNGPMVCLYPDAATTPFRGEKNTNWEGGWRVPAFIRWPGVVKPGTRFTEIFAGEDWMPTFLAAAGVPDIKEKLLTGHKAGDKTFKVHLDGYNQMDYLAGKAEKGSRKEFFYFSDDGDLLALRYERLKIHFMIQEATGLDVWRRPFTTLRGPIFFDLEVDPFERGQEGMGYNDWWYRRAFLAVPVQKIVGKTLMTFKDFPPRQKPASFTIDQAMEALMRSTSGGGQQIIRITTHAEKGEVSYETCALVCLGGPAGQSVDFPALCRLCRRAGPGRPGLRAGRERPDGFAHFGADPEHLRRRLSQPEGRRRQYHPPAFGSSL
jgi:arylsulfatase